MNVDDFSATDLSATDVSATETTYFVDGMTCGHCAAAVTGELLRLHGVRDASVDLTAGTATVVSDSALDESDVRVAVEEAGYSLAHARRLPLL